MLVTLALLLGLWRLFSLHCHGLISLPLCAEVAVHRHARLLGLFSDLD